MLLHVLLVDDEPLILKSVEHSVDWEKLGCKVAAKASNGRQAMECMSDYEIDILITDISMPKSSGIDLIKETQRMEEKPLSILISGYDDFEYAREGLKYNAFDYILKPIDYDELEQCVEKAVQQLRVKRQELYDVKKNMIYEAFTNGHIHHPYNTSSSVYLPMEMHADDEMKMLETLNDRIGDFSANTYLFSQKNNYYIVMIECDSFDTERLTKLKEQVMNGLKEMTDDYQTIVLYDEFVRLEELKDAVKQNAKLMEMEKFTDEKLITKSYMEEFYKNKQSIAYLIDQALEFMENHFDQDIGNEEVAAKIGLSVSYFSCIFKKAMNMTFLEYLTDIRIQYACQFLIESDWKTYQIANKVGYVDQRYFSQVFKKKVGMTPTEYRKKHQK
ncbi:response regulator [Gracilibacillus sp. YIM 98692]|uniref:response regulator transcription factor n=1 Tax=Gracilibacillus sp. YIM 98692 TaxID=2663532 RepID=UPI0013D47492|nr:response regulator [Gracilibacillus sp. YIM 98692]